MSHRPRRRNVYRTAKRPCFEILEDRLALSTTYVVDTTADSGAGSLRWAIDQANLDAARDTIVFDVAGSGVHTISLSSALPTITEEVEIDGFSQSGVDGVFEIELDGSSAGSGVDGLSIAAGGSTIRGLVINGFSGYGVRIQTGGENIVSSNRIGTNVDGDAAVGNGGGVYILNSSNNTIGGTSAGAGNLISGNAGFGIYIVGAGTITAESLEDLADPELNLNTATGNLIVGNRIGLNADGDEDLGNQDDGVRLKSAGGNVIGGTSSAARNLISGNGSGGSTADGVEIAGDNADWNQILGNYIGLDATGAVSIGNRGSGVHLAGGAQKNQVGSAEAGGGNIISGNLQHGVHIEGTSTLVDDDPAGPNYPAEPIFSDPEEHSVNPSFGWVPTDLDDDEIPDVIEATVEITTTLPGGDVTVRSTVEMPIDPDGPDEFMPLRTAGNAVIGNFIGTDSTGEVDRGNSLDGVHIDRGALLNIVGTFLEDEPYAGQFLGKGNLISGNDGNGVAAVGLNSYTWYADGILDQGFIDFQRGVDPGPDPQPDPTTTDLQALIHILRDADTVGVFICGNLIGTNADGDAAIANGGDGVLAVDGARAVIVGFGADASPPTWLYDEVHSPGEQNLPPERVIPELRNIISGNAGNGVRFSGAMTVLVAAGGNYIGTNADGDAPLGNQGSGVVIENAARESVVGSDPVGGTFEAGNLIAGNAQYGVRLSNNDVPLQFLDDEVSFSSGIYLCANLIGVNAEGVAIANGLDGVFIEDSANVVVGGLTDEARNVISGNTENGVRISGQDSYAVYLLNNYIGFDPRSLPAIYGGQDLDVDPVGNGANGVLIENGAHNNQLSGVLSRSAFRRAAAEGFLLNPTRIYEHYLALINAFDAGEQIPILDGGAPVEDPLNLTLDDERNILSFSPVALTARVLRNYIAGNGENGVVLDGEDTTQNVVAGSWIGTDLSGQASFDEEGALRFGNAGSGIVVRNGAHDNVIGQSQSTLYLEVAVDFDYDPETGITVPPPHYIAVVGEQSAALQRNVIAGNGDFGVLITGVGTDDNVVRGNYIGVSKDADLDLGNFTGGVKIVGGLRNVIGTDVAGVWSGNVVVGNGGNGVWIQDTEGSFDIQPSETTGLIVDLNASSFNTVAGNLIGLTPDGTPMGNDGDGVLLEDAGGFIVGGFTQAARNVISFNGGANGAGVHVNGDDPTGAGGAVAGNYIGTDASGDVVAPAPGASQETGVQIDGGTASVTIGRLGLPIPIVFGEVENFQLQGNLISGNAGAGVAVHDWNNEDGNTIDGNRIVANGGDGVLLENSTSTIVGEGFQGAGNIIIQNGGAGVAVVGSSSAANSIFGNFIGTDEEGAGGLGNDGDGVFVENADATFIGGFETGTGNVIADNDGYGILVAGSAASITIISDNWIGGSPDSASPLGNQLGGVRVAAGAGSTIIGTVPDGGGFDLDDDPETPNSLSLGNVIVNNGGPGVAFVDVVGDLDDDVIYSVSGNFIGVEPDGDARGNVGAGVLLQDASEVIVGGWDSAAGNVIAANGTVLSPADGITITGSDAFSNFILGNFIGTNASLAAGLGNTGAGVSIADGAHDNLIGRLTMTGVERNVIAYNGLDGVRIDDALGNMVSENSIFDNDLAGIYLLNGGNEEMAAPAIASAVYDSMTETLTITFSVNAAGSANYPLRIEFFIADDDQEEGKIYLGAKNYTTNNASDGIVIDVSGVDVDPGDWEDLFVVATATDEDLNTSEFSGGVNVTI